MENTNMSVNDENRCGFVLNFDEAYDIVPRHVNEFKNYLHRVYPNGYPSIPYTLKQDCSMEDVINHFKHRVFEKPLLTNETDVADWRKSVLWCHGMNMLAFELPMVNQNDFISERGDKFHLFMMKTMTPDQYILMHYLNSLGVTSELLLHEVGLREAVLRCNCRLCNEDFEWYAQFWSFQPLLRYMISASVDRSVPSNCVDQFKKVRSVRLRYGLSSKLRNIIMKEKQPYQCQCIDIVYQVCDRLQQLHDGCNGRFFNLIDLCRASNETDQYYHKCQRELQAAVWDFEDAGKLEQLRFERVRNAYTLKYVINQTDITPEKMIYKRFLVNSGMVNDEMKTYWLVGSDNYTSNEFDNLTTLMLPHDKEEFLDKWYHWDVCFMWTDIHGRYISSFKNHRDNVRRDNAGNWDEWYDPGIESTDYGADASAWASAEEAMSQVDVSELTCTQQTATTVNTTTATDNEMDKSDDSLFAKLQDLMY